MRENADNGLSEDRAEAARCIHGVLDKLVGSAPVPFAHEFRCDVGFVDFDANDERDVGVIAGFFGEEGIKRWTVLDGPGGEDIHVCVEAAVVPQH